MQHVQGQTSRMIKTRLSEHRSTIRTYLTKSVEERKNAEESGHRFGETSVARHFQENKHNVSNLRWAILEQINIENVHYIKNKLLRREAHWIIELETLTPKGLNENCHMSAFL